MWCSRFVFSAVINKHWRLIYFFLGKPIPTVVENLLHWYQILTQWQGQATDHYVLKYQPRYPWTIALFWYFHYYYLFFLELYLIPETQVVSRGLLWSSRFVFSPVINKHVTALCLIYCIRPFFSKLRCSCNSTLLCKVLVWKILLIFSMPALLQEEEEEDILRIQMFPVIVLILYRLCVCPPESSAIRIYRQVWFTRFDIIWREILNI